MKSLDIFFTVCRGIFAGVLLFGLIAFIWTQIIFPPAPRPYTQEECIFMAQSSRWQLPSQCFYDYGESFMCQLQGSKRTEYLPAKCLKYFKS